MVELVPAAINTEEGVQLNTPPYANVLPTSPSSTSTANSDSEFESNDHNKKVDGLGDNEGKQVEGEKGEQTGLQGAELAYAQTESAETKEERLERESRYLSGTFYHLELMFVLDGLHQTILAPALPVIASKFSALDQIAWIASAYFLTQTAFLLLYGQVLTVFDRKWTFLFAIAVFEIGSLVCAIAPGVDVLIFGRAFAGCGAAGIFVSCLSIISEVTRLEQRPKLLGLFGGVFAISSVIGPLLGGAFTDKVTWRLCFYINLPFGAVTILAVCLILGPTPPPRMLESTAEYTERKFSRWTFGRWIPARHTIAFRLGVLDWTGSILMLATITCLLLPLQWGGTKYAWDSGPIIGTFVTFGALVVIFVIYEWKFAGDSSILPLRFFRNRSQCGACLEAFCLMFTLLLATYYLPIFFQATKGVSATQSGISILPFMISTTVAAGMSGAAVSIIGYYWPWCIGGPTLICIAGGLLYTVNENSSSAQLIGYQILLGTGVGTVLQNVIIAVQADIDDVKDVTQATGLVTFAQLVGGTIGIAIASTIFGSKLASGLHEFAPDAPFELVRNSVAAIKTLPIEQQAGVIHAYVKALNVVFLIGVGAGAAASLSALLIRNLSVKGKKMMEMGA